MDIGLHVIAERPDHAAAIEALTDLSFGPARFTKTVYRFRDQIPPIRQLGFVIEDVHKAVVSSLRFWPATLPNGEVAALLGPISVAPSLRGLGYGSRLIHHGIMRTRSLGYPGIILVGDAPYYNQFGFTGTVMHGLRLPGPVDRKRLLGMEFTPGMLDHQAGIIQPYTLPATHEAEGWSPGSTGR
ncbi:MAG: N-acetyltransferase [Pseudomonadota bacterium]